jgi:phosphoribosyl 1,2-cyclic phosphate phosphodiesterase
VSLGFRVGGFAYSCDLSGIPDNALNFIQNLDVWILDALRPMPHPSHLSLPEALDWVERIRPRQAVLTNLHVDMDYANVKSLTPDHVTPAYDGMVIDVTEGCVCEG